MRNGGVAVLGTDIQPQTTDAGTRRRHRHLAYLLYDKVRLHKTDFNSTNEL